MSLKEMDQFTDITNKIRELIAWYENNYIDTNVTKLFLSNGDSLKYNCQKHHVPHLLGVNIEYLLNTGLFKSNSAYDILKELCDNYYRFSEMIINNKLKIENIFSKYIYEKLKHFKNNISISLNDTLFICKYNRDIAYYQGKEPLKMDYIILKQTEDGTFLELDLTLKYNNIYPISAKIYNDETEMNNKLSQILKYQEITLLSSIIVDKGFYEDNQRIFLNDREKILKLKDLERYRNMYDCHTDVAFDLEFYYKKSVHNREDRYNDRDIYGMIIDSILSHKIINKNNIDIVMDKQQLCLIDAVNDMMVNGNNNENYLEYSKLEKRIKKLEEVNKELSDRNTDLQNKLDSTTKELDIKNNENIKTKKLVKTVMNAIDEYNS